MWKLDCPPKKPNDRTKPRGHTCIPSDAPILFLEVDVEDPSEFEDVLEVRGAKVSDYRVLRA